MEHKYVIKFQNIGTDNNILDSVKYSANFKKQKNNLPFYFQDSTKINFEILWIFTYKETQLRNCILVLYFQEKINT